MATKYRIEYGDYPRYQKRTKLTSFIPALLLLLLCATFLISALFAPKSFKLSNYLLPGDPAVTADAFQQLAETIHRGGALSDALDVFCETIMEAR